MMIRYSLLFVFAVFIITSSCQKEEKDVTPPTISLFGNNPTYVNYDSAYVEPGYTATDDVDGDIASKVEVTGSVDVHKEGSYTLYYNVRDNAGNKAIQEEREVKVLKF